MTGLRNTTNPQGTNRHLPLPLRHLTAVRAAVIVAAVALIMALVTPVNPQLPATARGDQDIANTIRPELTGARRHVGALVVDHNDVRQALFDTTATNPFYVGSLTKLFTVDLYRQAVERNEVSPTTPLGELLPMWGSPAASITLDELAHHESGLGEWGAEDTLDNDISEWWSEHVDHRELREHTSREQLFERARLDPLKTKGTYHYSNIGIALLGHALATAARMDYERLLRERILQPLGMNNTRLPNPDVFNQSASNPPRGLTTRGTPADVWDLGAYSPSAGAVSTLMDMGIFARYLLGTIPPGTAVDDSHQVYRGFLVSHPSQPNGSAPTMLSKTGTVSGFQSAMMIDVERGRAAIILSDADTPVLAATEALINRERNR